MKKITYLLFGFLLHCNTVSAQNIVINEMMASNTISIQDEDDSHEDWIELYNKGGVAINLSGYGLTDDPTLPFKWTFPNITISAGQYLIVWASDKNRTAPGSALHTNFKISSSGETIVLTNASAVTVNSMPPANLQSNVSYGRLPNGTGPFVYFGTPTPGSVNNTTGYSGFLSPPVFSQNSGFFTTSFSLALSSIDSGTTLLYTLDGSEPDENNLSGTTYTYKNQYPQNPGQAFGPFLTNSYSTQQYSAPLTIVDRSSQPNDVSAMSSTFDFNPTYIPTSPVFKGTTVRVKVIKPGFLSSKVVTKTYFVTPQGSNKFSLPVISINLNEDRFFDYNEGIFVAGKDFDTWRTANPSGFANSSNAGNYYRQEDERTANFSYFVNGNEVISQDVGLRIRGGVSRRFRGKSLTVFARSDYGDSTMDYKFFTDLPYTSYERLTISNSGGDFKHTMFRDALNQNVCKELLPEKEAYQPTVTFVNGEYWGILNLRERYDDEYFERVYNADEVDFLENNSDIKEGDAVHYDAMVSYLHSNSLAIPEKFDYIKTQLDTENATDYFISNIFFENEDWPNNNMYFWRNKIAGYNATAPAGLDGRWRYLFHDMDNTYGYVSGDPNSNTLATATSVNTSTLNPDWSTIVLRSLLANTSYKYDFINRFADLLNTSFLSSRISSKLNSMKAVIYPEIPNHIERWESPATLNDYNYYINWEQSFINVRPTNQRNHIRTVFGLSSNVNATLNVSNSNHGYVKINTIDIIDGTPGITGNPYPWTGIYFTNVPLTMKAIAKPGFVFSHWTGASTSTNPEITYIPTGDFSVTAVFVADVAELSVPIYFWMMNGSITNGAQLTFLNSTYELGTEGVIQYQSCLTGYPYISGNPNFGKASMERRNNPTSLNYRPDANGNLAFASSDMRGLQIKQPFKNGGLENTMVFNFSTLGYKKIKFSFAAVDEGAANAIAIDYSVNPGSPVWITTGLTSNTLPLTNAFQLFTNDFSGLNTVENNPNFKIRMRFTGPNMTADTGARVTFNNIAVDGVKMPLSYVTPNVFVVGTTITNLTPSTTETINSFSISPALPAGLSFNTSNGIISGTPTNATAQTTYTVSATNASGTVNFDVLITINAVAPSGLSYTSPNVFTKNTAITNLVPTVSGGTVMSYSISPSLPLGMTLDTESGVISGTPAAITAMATYTVTATNSGGSTSFGIVITINEIAPNSLTYNSPNIFIKNNTISSLTPSASGGAILSYSISPALPSGLLFDTATGIISGTPIVIATTATYTVTATNASGSTSFGVVITVNDVAPTTLTYNSPNVFTKNTTISNLNPTTSGGAVLSYQISPALPLGLTFNTSSGIISGTPTIVTATTTYTVTAANSGGSTSFGIVITVNDIATNSLAYPTPNVFTKNTMISNLSPTVSGGAVESYSISTALPLGLLFNTSTGVISGTPTVVASTATYIVTATNSGGSSSFGIVITVNDIAPSSLAYNSPNIFTKNNVISNLTPSTSGGMVLSYGISPALPSGLSLNTATGVISGTPTTVTATATYTVTATNSGGSASFGVVITVNDIAPNSLAYNSPNVFTKNNTISNLVPSVSGGTVLSYGISPELPLGLSFNAATGVISGTPIAVTSTATYFVTASNSGGSTSFGIVITVNDFAPNSLAYNSPNVFTRNTAISELNPIISGGEVLSYGISPALPLGLSFNNTTGVISGTPTMVASTATYTVTATNSGGSTSFGIVITVNDTAPNSLVYTSPNVFTKNTTISNLNPIVSGGAVLSYGISPALPSGLVFNTSNGVISGTPTTVTSTATYTITAINSGGSTSFGIVITVNDIAPNSLAYNSPNVFTLGNTISNLIPTVVGNVVSYSIFPGLPAGLAFNNATGVISGTPTTVSPGNIYTVTTFNSGGSVSFDIAITINEPAPDSLSYSSPNVFMVGSAITNLTPFIAGDVTSYSVSPSLPVGLSLNTVTGIITGTPAAVTGTGTYTVTANNSGGSVSFGIVITINDAPPAALSYSSPNVITVGMAISLTPSITGTVASYSIIPSLPLGLSFNTMTGTISGTPMQTSATAIYTVTAQNSGGSISFDIVITVNDEAPTAFSYASPNVLTVGNAIALSPSITGTVASYNINPTLPFGLSFDTSTGIIAGTPTQSTAIDAYTVTASNSGGSISFDIVITVNDEAPTSFSYPSPNVYTVGNAISLSPSITGMVAFYSINPALPFGLSLDTTSGIISGTPMQTSGIAAYTVSAHNSGGSISFDIVITVNDEVPTAFSYSSPNVLTVGNAIALSPSITGTVASYHINPQLPLGLSFDTATGIISGTPTQSSAIAAYTVTAQNSGGAISFDVVITVNDTAPTLLSYTSPNVFVLGYPISNLLPSVSGDVTSYRIFPDLPSGLSLNIITGIVSGTPTSITSTSAYTATAENSGGAVSFDIIITVNDMAPNALNYPSPNIATIGNSMNIAPEVTGNVVSYSINPGLPLGLSFDTTTGIISGIPTSITSTATYTVTAQNTGGSISFDVVITVNDAAPSSLNYPSINVFTVGDDVTISPVVAGNVVSYSIVPTLPPGLIFDAETGIISGTPTESSPATTYTIIASNSGGSISFAINITVEDILIVAEKQMHYDVSPNPFTEYIDLVGPKESVTYEVYSAEGSLVQEGKLYTPRIEFRNISSGMYILKLYWGKNIQTIKLVRQ